MSIEQIEAILRDHVGKKNMIKAEAIAEMIGLDPGPSGVIIRGLITETIVSFHLPVASSNRGYYLLENSEDLKRYQRSLDGRVHKITSRRILVTQYFSEFYNQEEFELGREIFEDIDEEEDIDEDD